MNLLPSLGKRKSHFANPLSGIVYNNDSFLRSCHNNPNELELQELTDRKQKPKIDKTSLKKPIQQRLPVVHKYQQIQLNKLSQTADMIDRKKIEKERLFPSVLIIILDAVENYKDIKQKVLITTFERYFTSFFKKSLLGSLDSRFLQIVQEVIHNLVTNSKLQDPIDFKEYPSDIFTLKSKKKFLEKIQDFREKGLENWVQAMVKFYCLPSQDYRDSVLRDVILTLVLETYERYNLPKDRDYALLQENGKQVMDICQVYFSTTKLFLTSETGKHTNYLKHLRLLDQHENKHKKLTFSQTIKRGFRKKIVKGNYEECKADGTAVQSIINPGVQKAQKMLLQRSNSKQRVDRTRSLNSKSRNSVSKIPNTERRSVHLNPNQTQTNLLTKSSGSSLKKPEWKSVLQTKIDEQFRSLQIASERYDIGFNRNPENEVQLVMECLMKEFIVFSGKSQQQINRILEAANIDPTSKYVSMEQFRQLRNLIQGKAQKQSIMRFVGAYLPFNQYNELSKSGLKQTLSFILNYKDQNIDVIEEVIWSWLDKNHLIEGDAVRKNTLQSWYQQYKLVYMMMISLIFGTNDVTPLEMAYQILI